MNEELSARNSREQYITVFKNSQLSKNAKLAFLDENTGIVLTELSDSVSVSYTHLDVYKRQQRDLEHQRLV